MFSLCKIARPVIDENYSSNMSGAGNRPKVLAQFGATWPRRRNFASGSSANFPPAPANWTDPVSRRNFVKIMSASFLLAGLGATGCRRPVEKIYPFAKMPENYVHGVPQYFATAMPSRRTARAADGQVHDGTADQNRGQSGSSRQQRRHRSSGAGLGSEPLRSGSRHALRAQWRRRKPAGRAGWIGRACPRISVTAAGLAFLLEQSSSPSRARLQKAIAAKISRTRAGISTSRSIWTWPPGGVAGLRGSVEPYLQTGRRRSVIVSLDCDFIGSEENACDEHPAIRQGPQLERQGRFDEPALRGGEPCSP